MKKSIMQKWVKALRSGKYKQAKGALSSPRGASHCCLGVLCDITKKETGGEWNGQYFRKDGNRGSRGYLPKFVRDFVGMKSINGTLPFDYFERKTSLAAENDEGGTGFKRIADIIEANYKKL